MSDSHLTNEQKLERIYELTLENHEILSGIRKRERLANSIRILYWLVVLGALGGAYYYVRPLVDTILEGQANVEETLNQFEQLRESLPQTKAIGHFLDSFKQATTTP